MQIRLLLIGFLCASVLALHVTTPQRHTVYIPAMDGPTKVRPANLPNPVPPVVSLIEADRRAFKEKAMQPPSPWDQPMPYKDYGLTLEASDGLVAQTRWGTPQGYMLDVRLRPANQLR